MFEYTDEGIIIKPSEEELIVNKITKSRYLVRDCKVVESNNKFYIHPIYSNKKIPIQYFELENWEIFKSIHAEIVLSDKHLVTLDNLKINNLTDSFNILLITYLKEVCGGSIMTTNPKIVKHILSILRKKPELPLPWKYVDEILEFATSSKTMFFQWLIKVDNELIFNEYFN